MDKTSAYEIEVDIRKELQDHLDTCQAVFGLPLDVDGQKNCKRTKKKNRTKTKMKTKKNMKNTIALSSILALALGAFLVQSPALAGPAIQGSGHVSNTAPNPNPPGPPIVETTLVEGATAKIHRNNKGITINIKTVGLKPNHVYTAWLVEVGVTGPGVPPQFLTGRIVGGSGKATFSGRRSTVVDAMAGEFHVVLADHGLKDPSTLPEEKRTFVPFIINPDGTWNYEQVAIFLPPSE